MIDTKGILISKAPVESPTMTFNKPQMMYTPSYNEYSWINSEENEEDQERRKKKIKGDN